MAVLRGGLIGCGFFAVNHLHAWREIEGAEFMPRVVHPELAIYKQAAVERLAAR